MRSARWPAAKARTPASRRARTSPRTRVCSALPPTCAAGPHPQGARRPDDESDERTPRSPRDGDRRRGALSRSPRPMTDEQPTKPPKRTSRLRRSAAPTAGADPGGQRPARAARTEAGQPARPRRAAPEPVLPLHAHRGAGGAAQGPRGEGRPGALPGRPAAASCSGDPSPPRRRSASASPRSKALAIFSSDAISSSAYATEEILRVLIVAGAVAFTLSLEVAIAIAILLAVVSTSYRQIGYAYPHGGGAYAVAKENLGRWAVADRGRRPPRGLHPHGGRLDVLGGRPDHLGPARTCWPGRCPWVSSSSSS